MYCMIFLFFVITFKGESGVIENDVICTISTSPGPTWSGTWLVDLKMIDDANSILTDTNGITRDEETGIFYFITDTISFTLETRLWSYDPCAGLNDVQLIGTITSDPQITFIHSLTFNPKDGLLYIFEQAALQPGYLWSIDPNTLIATKINDVTFERQRIGYAAVFDQDGILYTWSRGSDFTGDYGLVIVDINDDASIDLTFVNDLGFNAPQLDWLALDPTDCSVLVGGDNENLYEISKSDGTIITNVPITDVEFDTIVDVYILDQEECNDVTDCPQPTGCKFDEYIEVTSLYQSDDYWGEWTEDPSNFIGNYYYEGVNCDGYMRYELNNGNGVIAFFTAQEFVSSDTLTLFWYPIGWSWVGCCTFSKDNYFTTTDNAYLEIGHDVNPFNGIEKRWSGQARTVPFEIQMIATLHSDCPQSGFDIVGNTNIPTESPTKEPTEET